MMFKTHAVFALLLSILFIQIFEMDYWYLFMFVSVFVAGIPDIDLHKSTYGKKIKPISFLLNLFFGHRGLFHSILFALALFFLFGILGNETLAAAALLGYTSHLILDGLTKEGIMPLTPISVFKIKGFIKSGGIFDWALFFCFVILIVLVLVR